MDISEKTKNQFYRALINKDPEYDGVFYVGVKTTGVFCRCICPARKPKIENGEFFSCAEDALLASFRPCKRCQPLSDPNTTPKIVQKLVSAVEENPEKRWKESDFEKLSTNAKQASRLFKKRFGMTFVAYARARRMGIAMKKIKEKTSVIDTQLDVGYESDSGFRDAFSKIMGSPQKKGGHVKLLPSKWIDTPLGPMLAIGDDHALYLLEFVTRRGLEKEIERLRSKENAAIVPGNSKTMIFIEKELQQYFSGKLKEFKTPIKLLGSDFQKSVWKELMNIPYGTTRSYKEMARFLKHEQATRAAANANGANQLAIIIPCHRVINTNGDVGGYGGGIPRKKWLLEHEKKHAEKN